ncbi:hypothetical protein BDA96_01G391000 [Sorghum bicolor]|uniref:F-box domain-containing protein n=1 Tax=Sorghum bicolor TaxID=4558 RepID=A0A921S467_SORBI|nr:hypothetical protein BDA96_01G391000 [Sorghum bicolor]
MAAATAAVSASPTPSDGEPTAAVDELGTTWRSLPTDAFVEILLRLPPSRQRLLRLVCRHWRAVIDERTPPQSNKPAVLACFTGLTSASMYVIDDDDLGAGRCRQVWGVRADPNDRTKRVDVTMVGTCNGLVCLCDNTRPGGAISLLNPATRETLRVPPLPISHGAGGPWSGYGSGKAYSFGFHPVTGRYRVLHLPCRADVTGGFTALQVFTLGDPCPSSSRAWRDVPVSFPGGATATCSVDAGLVTVDGATYWVTKGAERVVSFDHEDERVAFAAPLPVEGGPGYVLRLMEVRGSLGLAVCADRWPAPTKTDVWVLGRHAQGWSRQYSVQVQAGVCQRLAGPHFAHGEYVLTVSAPESSLKHHLYAHRMRGGGAAGRLQSGEVRSLRIRDEGTVAAYLKGGYYYLRTFAYVQTTEPLSRRCSDLPHGLGGTAVVLCSMAGMEALQTRQGELGRRRWA